MTLAEAIASDQPRRLWTLCERDESGDFPDTGIASIPINMEYTGLDTTHVSAGPVCAKVTPCDGVRFTVVGTT